MITVRAYARQTSSDPWKQLDLLTIELENIGDISLAMYGRPLLEQLAGMQTIHFAVSIVGMLNYSIPFQMRISYDSEVLDLIVKKAAQYLDTTYGHVITDIVLIEGEAL